jgi:purine-nucleoside phosphorylase
MAEEHLRADLRDAHAVLAHFIGAHHPVCGIVLGSGLNPYAEHLVDTNALSYRDVPHMHVSTAAGHKGQFVLGRIPLTSTWVLCMQGRLHGYEGITSQDVAFPVWCMAQMGIGVLLTTNAAGAINPSFRVGDFCAITDHINFTGRNPLVGTEPAQIRERFVPMAHAYDENLLSAAQRVAQRHGIALRTGVYLGLGGPSFETAAEIRMFSAWGADTVAMSVVEEVIAARHMGMRVFGMSLISNMACGVAGADPNSAEVMETAESCLDSFTTLIDGIIQSLVVNGCEQ